MPTADEREYFARRAGEIRSFAEAAQDPEIKATLQTMAASYDKLVEADRTATLRLKLPAQTERRPSFQHPRFPQRWCNE